MQEVSSRRVLIIGAGLSGLAAAHALLAGPGTPPEILVVDKGRSVGGRLATRRMGRAVLDHGAQFFTVRSEAFRIAVDGWLEAGVVEEWSRGFATDDGYPRYRVVGGMNALAKHLARALGDQAEILTGQRAGAVIPSDRWAVTYDAATREPDEADAIIATPPIPQTLALLAAGPTPLSADVRADLEAMSYHKVVAILTRLDRSPGLPAPGALQRPDHPVFTFVADNQAKGISDEPAVTFHVAHALSAELWGRTDAEILDRLATDVQAEIGDAEIADIQVKRWRYSGPAAPHPEPYLLVAERPGPLVLAGDGFGGSKVEGAFLSGLAAAGRVLAALDA